MPEPPKYRWLTAGCRYAYRPRPGKGRDDLRGQPCTVQTLPRPGAKPANVRVQFDNGETHVVPSGVLRPLAPPRSPT